jgi:hypothetical protein
VAYLRSKTKELPIYIYDFELLVDLEQGQLVIVDK